MTKLLTKEHILASHDLKTRDIEVSEWGGTIRVSQISAADRIALQMMALDDKGKPRTPEEATRLMTIGLLTMSIVDESGVPLFTRDDIVALGKKNSDAIDKVFSVADEINGISTQMTEKLRKNL